MRLRPDPHDPGLLAAVRLTGPFGVDDLPADPVCDEVVARRHTSRRPFTGRPGPEPIVAEMTPAARAACACLHVPDIAGARRLLRLTAAVEAVGRCGSSGTADSTGWARTRLQRLGRGGVQLLGQR